MLSDDPRLSVTAWQDVAWLPSGAVVNHQRARIRGGNVEFSARFTIPASGVTQSSAVIPADRVLSAGISAMSSPMIRYSTGAYVGTLNVNSSGTVQMRATAASPDDVFIFTTWPTA